LEVSLVHTTAKLENHSGTLSGANFGTLSGANFGTLSGANFGTLSGANFDNLNYFILNSNHTEIKYRGVTTILFWSEIFVITVNTYKLSLTYSMEQSPS
jgi:hypothetical protein